MRDRPLVSRRHFLQLVVAGAATVAATGVLGACRSSPDAGDRWNALLGDQVDAVREVGRRTVDAGLFTSPSAALEAIPATGLTRDDGELRVADPAAFASSVGSAATVELDAGELETLDAFLFAPTELALAALVYLEP